MEYFNKQVKSTKSSAAGTSYLLFMKESPPGKTKGKTSLKNNESYKGKSYAMEDIANMYSYELEKAELLWKIRKTG